MARKREVAQKIKKISKDVGDVISKLFAESSAVSEDDELDDLDDDDFEEEDEDEALDTCVIQVGLTPLTVEVEGQTVSQAFNDNQEELGFNPRRSHTFKANNVLVDPSAKVEPNKLYLALPTGEKKA